MSKSVKEIIEGQVDELRVATMEVHKIQEASAKQLEGVTKAIGESLKSPIRRMWAKLAGKEATLAPLEEIVMDLGEVTNSLTECVHAVDSIEAIGPGNMLKAVTEIHEVAERSTLRLRTLTLTMEETLKSPVAKLAAMATGKRAFFNKLIDIENNQASIVACLADCVSGVAQMKEVADVQRGVTSIPAPAAAQEGK